MFFLIAVCVAVVGGLSTVAASGSTSDKTVAKGSDVNIGVYSTLSGAGGAFDPWQNAVLAAINAVNAKGGANGHKLVAKKCDMGTSANSEQKCGRAALNDNVVGIISSSESESGILPFVQKGKIPTFTFLCDRAFYTSPYSYSVTSPCPAAIVAGMVGLGKKLSCKKFAMIRTNQTLNPAQEAAFAKDYLATAKKVGINAMFILGQPGAADMSPYISRALSAHADCIFMTGFGADIVALLKAADQATPDKKVKLMTTPALITPDAIKSLGAILDRVYSVSFTWTMKNAPQHPCLNQFSKELKQYGPSPTAQDNNSMDRWADTHALITAIAKVKGAVTAASVKAELDKFHNYNPCVGPPVSFDKPNTVPGNSRLFGPYAIQVKFVKGATEAVGGFFNFFTGKPVPAR